MQTPLHKFFNSALYGDGWQNLQSNQITSEQNPEVPMDNMAGWDREPLWAMRRRNNIAFTWLCINWYFFMSKSFRSAFLKPSTHYPHVTWAHIKLTFYFQLLPCPFPCIGSHMLIYIIWWLGVILKGLLAHFFSKYLFHFWKQLVTSEERSTLTSRLTKKDSRNLRDVLAREPTRALREITWRKQSDRSVNLRHRIQC